MAFSIEHVVVENRFGDPVAIHRITITDRDGRASADRQNRSLFWFKEREGKRLSAALKGSTDWLQASRIERFCDVRVAQAFDSQELIYPMHQDVPVQRHDGLESFFAAIGYDRLNKAYKAYQDEGPPCP